LRGGDRIAYECRGRWWLVAPRSDARSARGLARRLRDTVNSAVSRRGLALEATIGFAVCPGDGRDAATLAAHADLGAYVARNAGRSR
jgi:GGDEF domain-containing protein